MEIEYQTVSTEKNEKKFICDTCKTQIEGIARMLILRDNDYGPYVIFSHYFFPCWDLGQLCQQYPNLCIDKLGFCIPDDVSITKKTKIEMKKDIKFWL